MKNKILQTVLVLSVFTSFGCFNHGNFFDCIEGNNRIETSTFELDDFVGIEMNIAADIRLTQGNQQFVEVEGQSNVIDNLDLRVRNHILEIEFDDCVNHDDLTFFITIPEIESLAINGSGNILGENVFDVDDLTLNISGSGDMDLGVKADDIDGKISGSGAMKLDGEMDNLDFNISGSGDLLAFDLKVDEADLKISGSGDMEVFVVDKLDIKITGSGDVFFKGNPKLDIKITGSGKVKDAN